MTDQDQAGFAAEQKDKRSTLRVPMIVEKLACGDGHNTFFGYARNLSRGGVFIASVNPRQPGELFDLTVRLPPEAGLTLKCRCEVVWRRNYARGGKYEPGMGLRFLDLPQQAADALERWLNGIASHKGQPTGSADASS